MFRRLGWIVASYLTRPLILIFFTVGAIMTAVGLFAGMTKSPTVYEPNYPQMEGPRLLVNSQATLEAVRREGRQAEVDGIDLNALWADQYLPKVPTATPQVREVPFVPPDKAFFQVLEEFPNLRTVTMTFYQGATGANELAKLPHLEYLAIDGVAPADFSWMRPLKELRWLETSFSTPLKGLSVLREVPKLETVVFRSRYEVTDATLEDMAALPHLKSLVLLFYRTAPQAPPPPLTEAGFAALDRSTSLQTLYVGSYDEQTQRALFALASKALPELDVEPARLARHGPLLFLIFPSFFFAMAIGTGLAAQFRGPLCRLAPGFANSHALVASVLVGAATLLAAARLIAGGYNPLASVIVAAALVAATVGMASADNTPPPSQVRKQQLGNLLRTLMLFGAMGPLILVDQGQAMLLGGRPVFVTLAGVIALAAVGFTVSDLRQRVKIAPGAGYLNRGGPQRRLLMQQYVTGRLFAVAGSERSIEAWPTDRPRWTWWRRVRRWQIGNAPFRLSVFVVMVLGFYVGFSVLFRSMSRGALIWSPGDLGGLRSQFLMGGIMLSLIITGRVAMAWRARMLVLPAELLRPCPRRAAQNEIAAAFLLDLVPPMLVVAAVGAIGINLDHQMGVDWRRVPFDYVVVGLAGLAITVGLASVGVVVKRDWLAVAIFVAIGVLLAGAMGVVTAMQATPNMRRHGLTPQVVESQLGLLFVVGTVLAAVMRQRFMRMEIGSRV